MPDGSRFVKKTIGGQIFHASAIVFDYILCVVIGFPLAVYAFFKEIRKSRKDIKGKTALVTGGGQGLGRCICFKLAEHGCTVAVVDINLQAAQATADEITSKGLKAKAYKADVTKVGDIEKLRDESLNDLGPIDILINNAGLMSNKSLDDTCENIEAMIKVNVLGPIMMTKLFLEQMKKNKSGHIACISSMAGLHASPFNIPYSATKFGVVGFMGALTENLRLEGWRSCIKTTCICPYYIKTRQEVIDFLNPNIRFPPLEIEETAHEVVEAILKEDHLVSIPWDQKFFMKITSAYPLVCQELVRDRFLKEYQFTDPTCQLNFDYK